MNKEASTQIAGTASPTGTASLSSVSPWLRTAGVVLLGSLLLALCAHASIPLWFTPVPLSLQPFGVLLLGLLLSPGLALATVGAYLLEGAAGLPVFAPGALGVAHLLGPTGGYLMAYPLAALLISALWRRSGRGFGAALASAAAGDLVILFGGALWLSVIHLGSLRTDLSLAALPFLPGDALKIAAAAGVAAAVRRVRRETR
ncbi:MAG: biotin transporter BioY [Terracidiphilus sp.]